MINKFLLSICLLIVVQVAHSQTPTYWNDTYKAMFTADDLNKRTIVPEENRPFALQFDQLSADLRMNAPKEFTQQKGHLLSLPLPNGTVGRYHMFYAPTMEQELQEKYPDIRSYRGWNINDPTEKIRITVSQLGLKGSIKGTGHEYYIEPNIEGQTEYYSVFDVANYDPALLSGEHTACGVEDVVGHSPLDGLVLDKERGNELRAGGEPVGLRVFRCAIAATGEFTVAVGGKANAIAKIAASVDRANQVFENEAGVRIVLIGTNDKVVFDDPNIDPYTGTTAREGRLLIGRNGTVLNQNLGQASYDIGHVYTNACSDVGGIAALASVCGGNKGNGVTCWYNSNIDYTVVRIVCHEMGHQFSCPHTMNLCDMDNETLSNGFEPGSGSTIMSYGGLCGNNNVVSGLDASRDITYYHSVSLDDIYQFTRFISCGAELATNNTRPMARMDLADGFTIPISTPFALHGEGIDMEGDNLTYSFEQLDWSSRHCQLGTPEGSCPAFRSFPPNNNDYRVFPGFSTIWNNTIGTSRTEVLCDYERDYNFIMTVRDNNTEVGAFGFDTVSFETDGDSGPFLVSYPNNGEDQIANSYVEVTWDVANTNVPPVSCSHVNIKMYRSNDYTSSEMLLENTANDGSEWVLMPNEEINNLRLKIEAADNIFFDISNRNFDIANSTVPGYSFGVTPNSARICLPNVFTTSIVSSAFGGFTGQLELEVTDGLPAGATYSFDETSIETSESTTLVIDLTNADATEMVNIEVRAISSNMDTLYRNIALDIVRNDYSSLTNDIPMDGAAGLNQSPSFTWSTADDADYYNVQLATSPAFGASIMEEWTNLTTNTVIVSNLLDKNTLFYWRVQGVNICGEGPWTRPSAFSTEAASCTIFEAPDKNVNVQKNATTEFNLNFDQSAIINDINITNFELYCEFLENASMSLKSPKGTEVVLAEKKCGNTTQYRCSFDDDAPTGVKCPPNSGKAYQPLGTLSAFEGEDAKGRWSLNVTLDNRAGNSILGTWSLEICASSVLDAPFMVINETFQIQTNDNQALTAAKLMADDNNNTSEELTFTLVTIPSQGQLLFRSRELNIGDTFSQEDLNNAYVRYNHTGAEGFDPFYFTVHDGEGGWTGTHRHDIEIDDDFPSSTTTFAKEALFQLYPNPAGDMVNIVFTNPSNEIQHIEVVDVNGKIVASINTKVGTTTQRISVADWTEGVYFIHLTSNDVVYTESLSIQR